MSKHGYRTEKDSLGSVRIPTGSLWGAQSQRSLANFAIGDQQFPVDFIHDFALLKKAAATTNAKLGDLAPELAVLIKDACDAIIAGKHDDQFPLSIWQTGSGTQTNMNLNEVIANLGNLAAGSELGSGKPIHPNNHVNRSQSSNDTFPTVMHISALRRCRTQLLPKLDTLLNTLETKQEQFRDKIKIGRTHLMDATPITLGQEIGAWRTQLAFAGAQIGQALDGIRELAIGATAVGTGINTRSQWADLVVAEINAACGFDFVPGSNKFAQLSGHEALLNLHQQLNLLAAAIFKMANDIRLMNSGPRCGLAEISIPANEPGSSIMPGKINPTQAEALTMVCCRVMGNNTTVAMCASQGQFQLNAYKPVIIHCVLESLQLLGDAILSFEAHCLRGLQGNDDRLEYYTQRSLMLVTALSPTVGYDEAATAAKLAQDRDITLREAVLELQLMSAEEFDRIVDPAKMLGPAAE